MAQVSAGPVLHSATLPERQLLAAARWTLLGSLLFVATILASRRVSGDLIQPLSGMGLIGVAVLSCLAAAAVRIDVLWKRRSVLGTQYPVPGTERLRPFSSPGTSRIPLVLFAAPGLAAIVLLAALTVPGSSLPGSLTAWFLLIGAEVATWLILLRPLPRATPPDTDASEEAEEAEFPPGLVQQVTRVLNDTGGESIHAVLRTVIPAGDRFAAIHVAFCPPLAGAPELSAHAIESAAEVQVTQAESFGARVEVRLSEPAAEDEAVLVELLGSVKAAQSA